MVQRNSVILSCLLTILTLAACTSETPVLEAEVDDRIAALDSVTDADQVLYDELLAHDPREFGPLEVAFEMRGISPDDLPPPLEAPAVEYTVGDHQTFWVHDSEGVEGFFQVDFELVYISEHAYFWVDTTSQPLNEQDGPAGEAEWIKAGETFDRSYVAVRAVYGEEESPGIDGDTKLFILHSDKLGNIGGIFGGDDQFPAEISGFSNEGQYFYVATDGAGDIAGDYYNLTLAHEFQHMIHSVRDTNEDGWMNEGLAVLAQQVAGFAGDVTIPSYLAELDQSLWYWSGGSADYGHAYLFLDYLAERAGMDLISYLVRLPANGLNSVDQALAEQGFDYTADDLYADFMLALYYNDPTLGDGRFVFENPELPEVEPNQNLSVATLPALYGSDIAQYGGIDILRFVGKGQAALSFHGAQSVLLTEAQPYSGDHFWWSGRADGSILSLTRAVDLSAVDEATLTYQAWFDIEKDWDYGYVMVSADDGQTWDPQTSTSSTDTNPNDNNFGEGITGLSGVEYEPASSEEDTDLPPPNPIWTEETVDLSPFAGQSILLRFVMITDPVANEEGFAIDDIAIPEIDFFDDAESGSGDWQAEGWVLSHNRVPQLWRVRVVTETRGGDREIIDLDLVDGTASLDVDFRQGRSLTIFITALTRYTTHRAPYRLDFTN